MTSFKTEKSATDLLNRNNTKDYCQHLNIFRNYLLPLNSDIVVCVDNCAKCNWVML